MAALKPTSLDREQVVRLTGDLLDERNADDITLAAVAERAGVTQPALYRHVDGAADLWRSLGLTTRSELARELAESILGLAGTDAVRAVAVAWRDYALTHPGRYRSTRRAPVAGDPELEAAVERILDILTRALRGFDLSDDDAVHNALMLRSALHGFVSFELGDGNPGHLRASETFTRLVDMLCTSFESTPI